MTPLQLRIKYRIETGRYSTYGRDIDKCYTYKGGIVTAYADWLEENLVLLFSLQSPIDIRQQYLTETGIRALDYKDRFCVRYKKSYKDWLEELLCEKLK